MRFVRSEAKQVYIFLHQMNVVKKCLLISKKHLLIDNSSMTDNLSTQILVLSSLSRNLAKY